jgi:hypothetical protein
MNRNIAIAAIIVSFVVGTLVASTPASGAKGGALQEVWDAIFGLQTQIDDLDESVATLEENTINCQNEFLVKKTTDRIIDEDFGYQEIEFIDNYELSPICESQLIPLSVDAGSDMTSYGNYYSDNTEFQTVFIGQCELESDGVLSENATFLDKITFSPVSITNDGTYELTINTNPSTAFVSGDFPDITITAALVEENESLPNPVPTPEELFGSFTMEVEITVADIYGNTVSDTVTYTCNPS